MGYRSPMPHADVTGQKILCEDIGGDVPPVILGHGFLMDHEMFVRREFLAGLPA